MANDLNQCMFLGRCGKDPEIRYSADGKAVANVSLAVGSQWKDKTTGQKQESTEWIRIVAFGKLAEIIGQYLTKGSQALFIGSMRTRKWQDQNGQDRYTTEIVADKMQMLGGGSGNNQQSQKPSQQPAHQASGDFQSPGGFDDFDDKDINF